MELKLGLSEPPFRKYLFVGEGGWYTLESTGDDNKPSQKTELPYLTGYLTDIVVAKVKDKMSKEEAWIYKNDIHIMADREYIIRSGSTTTFSRSVILSLETLINDNFNFKEKPISILVSGADENQKVSFGAVFVDNEKVWFDWASGAKEKALGPVIKEIQKYLGVVIQTAEMINDPQLRWNATKALKEEHTEEPQKKSTKRGTKK